MTAPRLNAALHGPLTGLASGVLEELPSIEPWLLTRWPKHSAPYSSVDVRNSGFQHAPVDHVSKCIDDMAPSTRNTASNGIRS